MIAVLKCSKCGQVLNINVTLTFHSLLDGRKVTCPSCGCAFDSEIQQNLANLIKANQESKVGEAYLLPSETSLSYEIKF